MASHFQHAHCTCRLLGRPAVINVRRLNTHWLRRCPFWGWEQVAGLLTSPCKRQTKNFAAFSGFLHRVIITREQSVVRKAICTVYSICQVLNDASIMYPRSFAQSHIAYDIPHPASRLICPDLKANLLTISRAFQPFLTRTLV
jgi:hypothetical protein